MASGPKLPHLPVVMVHRSTVEPLAGPHVVDTDSGASLYAGMTSTAEGKDGA